MNISKYFAGIGKRGGEAKTKKKSNASRMNGKKGGRPKKSKR